MSAQMTDRELVSIETRAEQAQAWCHGAEQGILTHDVPALVAEVRRLQENERRGYIQALNDVEAYALHWWWDEDGERGTGEAFSVAWVVHLLREGKRAPQHRGERAERAEERANREIAEMAALVRGERRV